VTLQQEYETGWKITEMMPVNSTGIKTHRDHFVFDLKKESLYQRIAEFRDLNLSDFNISSKYDLKDTRDWKMSKGRKNLAAEKDWELFFTRCLYRPFDLLHYYHHKDVVERTRNDVMRHIVKENNMGLITCRNNLNKGYGL
jgi:predicted helicase